MTGFPSVQFTGQTTLYVLALQSRNCGLYRNGNFCKGTYVCKIIARAEVDARAVLLKRSTGFCRMYVTAILVHLGALLRDNFQIGTFS